MRSRTGAEGFVSMRSGVEADVAAVAAPVHRAAAAEPAVIGVINVVGPSYRLDDQRLREVGLVVAREARALSERFGTNSGVAV
jgi:urocanate hydratase